MKILIVPDIPQWAIGRLAQAKIKYNKHINWKCYYVHPRDAGIKKIQQEFIKIVNEFNPDIIHFEFYRTCSQLLEALPELKSRKLMLTHHNQRTKALNSYDWFANGIDYLITHTENCKNYLIDNCGQPENIIDVINHGIDLQEFWYDDIEPKEPLVGYVGRIVPWKGLKEIARACKELGYKLQIMGKHDKPTYWNEILAEGYESVFDFGYFDCKNEERRDAYKNITIYVGNSKDGYEEGTMSYLEAMACGVPIVTTPNGVANDIGKDRINCLMTPFENYELLKDNIQELMENKELRQKLRKNAWQTVKNMSEERMAYEYNKLYNKIKYKQDLVSIIIPITFNRIEQLYISLDKLKEQKYKAFEVIIAFDELDNKDNIKKWIELEEKLKNKYQELIIKTIFTGNKGYGLAMARNMGAIESVGKYLLFLDSRLMLERDAIYEFIEQIKLDEKIQYKVWYFGNKGGNKRNFIENFSFIKRKDFFIFGMFCERINAYGGMSQEVRTRWIKQKGQFKYVEDSNAIQLLNAKGSRKRNNDIINMKYKLYKMYDGENH